MQFRNVSRRRFLIFSLRWVFYTPLPQPQFTVNSMYYECSSMIPLSGNVVILTKTKDYSMWTKWAKERGQWKLLVEGVTETRVSGTCSTVEKYGLKASRTRLFITFCQIFVIFDDFSKFRSSAFGALNFEKSSNKAKIWEKIKILQHAFNPFIHGTSKTQFSGTRFVTNYMIMCGFFFKYISRP